MRDGPVPTRLLHLVLVDELTGAQEMHAFNETDGTTDLDDIRDAVRAMRLKCPRAPDNIVAFAMINKD